MIVVLGGTTETRPVAEGLVAQGCQVVVSTATDASFPLPDLPGLTRRQGGLDSQGWISWLGSRPVDAVVDVSHPYAVTLRDEVQKACLELQVPYLAYLRPAAVVPGDGVTIVETHDEAAEVACSFGSPLLVTVGSRHLVPYVSACRCADRRLVVRVLDHSASLEACAAAGLRPFEVLPRRGPFSLEDNCATIDQFGIGVVVTKDGGAPSGVADKLAAARMRGCEMVVVDRPPAEPGAFSSVEELVTAVCRRAPVEKGAP